MNEKKGIMKLSQVGGLKKISSSILLRSFISCAQCQMIFRREVKTSDMGEREDARGGGLSLKGLFSAGT